MKIQIVNKIVTVQSENYDEAQTLFNLAMDKKGASYLKPKKGEDVVRKRRRRMNVKTCVICGKVKRGMKQHMTLAHPGQLQ